MDVPVSSSLHAYIITQLVALQSVCSHAIFNPTHICEALALGWALDGDNIGKTWLLLRGILWFRREDTNTQIALI